MPARTTTPAPPAQGREWGHEPAGPYRGRFAPTPSGPLHPGSLVAALASWLDARAHGGRWLVRIEDVDQARCPAAMGEHILAQLASCGLVADETPLWQSQRTVAYERALSQLRQAKQVYACTCSRSQIDAALRFAGQQHERHSERVYPGTCRSKGFDGPAARNACWRLNTQGQGQGCPVHWYDRRLGPQSQRVDAAVGDFVLGRTGEDAKLQANYQLAVVVDDAAQGITHVVRGQDLLDNTARQIALQRQLGLHTPQYLHTTLVMAADGQKLSKQNGAAPLALETPLQALSELRQAAHHLGLPAVGVSHNASMPVAEWLAQAVPAWAGMMAGFSTTSQPWIDTP